MKGAGAILLSVAVLGPFARALPAQSDAAAAFERLKSLAGEWHGESGEGRPVNVSFQVVSGGSVVIETLAPADEASMITVYHLDRDKLVLTHYCSAGNQPRLRAGVPAGEIEGLSFAFVDVTNLSQPSAGHMHGLALAFLDEDRISQAWTWRQEGKDVPTTFNLEREEPGRPS